MVSNSTTNDDKLLWQAFLLGDEVAFTTLYQRHVRVLFSYGKKLLSDEDAVEDLIQELFIDLWQTRSRLSQVESPRFYLFRSLRRRIHKSLSPANTTTQNWECITEETLPVTLPQEFYIIEEEDVQHQKDSLNYWLKNLPIRQYEVLMLRYYQDFSYAEISEILSINEQSVRNLIQRGVSKLRQLSLHNILLVLLFNFFS
ncbi:RNA polymerase sigma factor [Dyadobacter sp. CY312]|uniref:RNA polymerase sigma factor n=1 Tax=Dyadobacter sp. CY312 TaxID=2907303 RepID=UPI001F3C088B|nr:sigma-70 family RNA polymerase sigma factor [Dyadobacter sp. CY312]MCE7042593.1 sigma-70 family RNA polymerase sigma factor [Dyadobacter sp. CY312]